MSGSSLRKMLVICAPYHLPNKSKQRMSGNNTHVKVEHRSMAPLGGDPLTHGKKTPKGSE